MPAIESLLQMDEITAEWLVNGLKLETVLVLDCRSQQDFQSGHIEGSMNVNLPPLLMRRLKKGNLTVSSAIQGNGMKEQFNAECNFKDIVMYDYHSTDVNANTCNLLTLLHDKLVKENYKVKVLAGVYLCRIYKYILHHAHKQIK